MINKICIYSMSLLSTVFFAFSNPSYGQAHFPTIQLMGQVTPLPETPDKWGGVRELIYGSSQPLDAQRYKDWAKDTLPEHYWLAIEEAMEVLPKIKERLTKEDLEDLKILMAVIEEETLSLDPVEVLKVLGDSEDNLMVYFENVIDLFPNLLTLILENMEADDLSKGGDEILLGFLCIANVQPEIIKGHYERLVTANEYKDINFIETFTKIKLDQGDYYLSQKEYQKAKAVFNYSLEVTSIFFDDNNPTRIRAADGKAYSEFMLGHYSQAEDLYRTWLDISTEALGKDDSNTVDTTYYLGRSLYNQKKYQEAEQVFSQFLEDSSDLFRKDRTVIWIAYYLGRSLDKQKKYTKAESVFREWLDLGWELIREHNKQQKNTSGLQYASSETISLATWLAGNLVRQGNYIDAEVVCKKWRPRSTKEYGNDNAKTYWLRNWLGRAFEGQQKYVEAESEFQVCLNLAIELFEKENERTIEMATRLGSSLFYQEKYSEAEVVFRKWLEISKSSLGNNDVTTIKLAKWLVNNFCELQEYSDAEIECRMWLDISKNSHGETVETINFALYLGYILCEQEEYDEAEMVFRQWLDISKNVLGEEHTRTLRLSTFLGWSLLEQKKYTEAEAMLRPWYEKDAQEETHDVIVSAWLGESLLRQDKYTPAEEYLLCSFRNSGDRRFSGKPIKPKVASLLVELYDVWGKPEEAEKYRDILEEQK